MTAIPPPLPTRSKRPSRDALVLIWAIVAICFAVVAWRVTDQWQEGSKIRKKAQQQMILNNLRQLAAAADQFFLENGTRTVTLRQVVGPGKYVKQLSPVDGEDYGKLNLNMDVKTWTIVTKSGITVTYKR